MKLNRPVCLKCSCAQGGSWNFAVESKLQFWTRHGTVETEATGFYHGRTWGTILIHKPPQNKRQQLRRLLESAFSPECCCWYGCIVPLSRSQTLFTNEPSVVSRQSRGLINSTNLTQVQPIKHLLELLSEIWRVRWIENFLGIPMVATHISLLPPKQSFILCCWKTIYWLRTVINYLH